MLNGGFRHILTTWDPAGAMAETALPLPAACQGQQAAGLPMGPLEGSRILHEQPDMPPAHPPPQGYAVFCFLFFFLPCSV